MAHEEKGFNPNFKNGGFWEYYKDLERQFENFLEYVPYLKDNESTYSFRLANIILAIGAHIDSALKKIAEDPNFSTKYPEMINPKTKEGKSRYQNICDFYPISEEYKLFDKVVFFKCLPNRDKISPFEKYQKKMGLPYWWDAYNEVKHHFSDNFKEANLKTVRDALAGAFMLNVLYEPATYRLFEYGLVEQKYQTDGYEKIPNFVRGMSREPKYEAFSSCINEYLIETPLFIYEYEYEKS